MPLLGHAGVPRAHTSLKAQARSRSWHSGVCAQVRSRDVLCVVQDSRNPQPLPGCTSSPSPCAAPLVPHHFSTRPALALLVAVCPRVLVAAIGPVWITLSFIPSDTGCGHNKTHLITEMLRVAGRGNGSLHLGSARSAAERGWRRQLVCLGCAKASPAARGRGSQRVNAAGILKRHRWEQEPLHLRKLANKLKQCCN